MQRSQNMGGRSTVRHKRTYLGPIVVLACVVLIAGCARTSSTTAHATPSTPATATSTPQPVVIAVSATAQGKVAQHNLVLETKVAITNDTSAPIHLTYVTCPYPVVILRLYEPSGAEGWHNYLQGTSCPGPFPSQDVQTIAVGATYVWRETDNLSNWVPLHLQTGMPFTLTADLLLWHQGSLSQIGTPTVPQGRDVMAQTTITFS